MTWATRPARLGTAIVDVGAMNTLGWYEFDVTSAITGDGTYSFDLASTSSDAMKFSSREVAAQAPQEPRVARVTPRAQAAAAQAVAISVQRRLQAFARATAK